MQVPQDSHQVLVWLLVLLETKLNNSYLIYWNWSTYEHSQIMANCSTEIDPHVEKLAPQNWTFHPSLLPRQSCSGLCKLEQLKYTSKKKHCVNKTPDRRTKMNKCIFFSTKGQYKAGVLNFFTLTDSLWGIQNLPVSPMDCSVCSHNLCELPTNFPIPPWQTIETIISAFCWISIVPIWILSTHKTYHVYEKALQVSYIFIFFF